ncbi:endolytic transglycosylase MltG [Microbacterium dauci]|uniref:Endolytic murein transglycosylase n=1 Tax=Microbacterium dauci TaxID=3048008 RepID=A0ABT6ZC71_9MICO|nr:endolytic transglycosylase MltG [Microbacterium sp. LX3-4]MDJ1113755.1 endolytic transglycosylase MltG [Microbacterium sp. LX3-4]
MSDTPSSDDPGVQPLSRRAAREARAADQAGTAPAAEPTTSTPQPTPTRPAEPVPPATSRPAAASLDALFEDQAANAPAAAKRHARDRKKSKVAAWTVFGVVLAFIGALVVGCFWVWNTYEDQIRAVMGWEEPKDYEPGLAEGEATLTIVSGDTGADISTTLFEAGVTKTSDAFYSYLIDTGQNPSFVPGVFSLQQKMTSEAALEAILDPANKQENTAQLREGLTVAQSVERIAEGVGLPLEDVQAAVADPSAYGIDEDSLEGWLFPATYTFDPDTTAEQVIQRMVDRTVQALDAAGVPEERRHEILTIASIIEKEARFEKDFYKVSRVIQNRLDPSNSETNGLLQMDSTAQYFFSDREGGTSSREEELTDDNPWNTYVHTGLPVGPIANPGELAIKAAMEPEEGPWLYFVTVNLDTGETVFTNTLSEHNAAVEQWRAWCSDNPDGGC